MTKYPDVEAELDSMKLLGMIKKLVYTGWKNDLNKSHDRVMAHLNLMNKRHDRLIAHLNSMNKHQDRFQDIQDFCDQNLTIKKCVAN